MSNKNTVVGGIIVILIIIAGGWYYFEGPPPATTATNDTVATVNGEAIMRNDLTASEAQLAAQQGTSATSTDAQAALQTQALNSLIAEKLLAQATKQAGVTASSTAVDAALASQKSQFQDDAAYQQALTQQGLTEAQLRDKIAENIALGIYFEQTLKLSAVTASDAEIQATYTQVSTGQTGVPPLSEIKDQVKQLVIQQKQQVLVNAQIDKLRAVGDVKVLI